MSLCYPFTLLHKSLRHWIEKKKLLKPTKIQELAIPKILEGKNVLLISPTGTGKTEAAILPIISKILQEKPKTEGVKAIYINPLKALTRNLRERIEKYTHFVGLRVRPLYGDVNKAFKHPIPEIIITTPESLEIILDWAPKWWTPLKTVKYIIIDETHELAYSKRGYQLLVLLERLKHLTKHNLQRIGLSATVGNPKKIAKLLKGSDNPLEILIAEEKRPHEFKLKLAIPLTEEEMKNPFLAGARTIGEETKTGIKTLIFTNSRHTAERLSTELTQLKIQNVVHHGSISKEERERFEGAFKTGLLRAIIATKTLELGIDIGDIQQVIQYRSPGQVYTLIQRAGRSQHKPGQKSICKIISTDPEDFLETAAIIKLAEEEKLEEPPIIENPLDVLAKEIIGISRHNQRGKRILKEKFHPINKDQLYEIIKKATPFNSLTKNTFNEVVKNLINNELIYLENKIPYPYSRFWSVWRFKEDEKAKEPSLNFSEFFSMIPKKETFTVLQEYSFGRKKKIGELDSLFVYRSLSTGMIIKLAGYNWKVVEIDEKNHEVIVTKTEEIGEAPTWKGEGPPRDQTVTKEMLKLINETLKNPNDLKTFDIDEKTANTIIDYLKNLDLLYLNALINQKIIIEKIPENKTTIFITFLGEKINRTLAAAIFEKIAENSLLVKYIVTPHGFAIKSEIFDPTTALKNISLDEFEKLVKKHIVEHSPFTKLIKDQIKEHFGFPWDERLIEKEAARQTLTIYYDINEALKALKHILNGSLINIVKDKPSTLGESILRYPYERPWHASLKTILEETINRFKKGTLHEIFEYTWSNPTEVKNELKNIAKEKDLITYFDLSSKGWTIAKIPLGEEWITVKVPITIKYMIVKKDDDIKRVEKELLKDPLPTIIEVTEEVNITFFDENKKNELTYTLKLDKNFSIILDTLIKTRIAPKYGKKVNIKVHIKKTYTTAIHYWVPTNLAYATIMNSTLSMFKMKEKGIISGKRQVIFELP